MLNRATAGVDIDQSRNTKEEEFWCELLRLGPHDWKSQQSVKLSEIAVWQKYMRMRGSLNAGRRFEAGSAMAAYMVNRMGGGKKLSYPI